MSWLFLTSLAYFRGWSGMVFLQPLLLCLTSLPSPPVPLFFTRCSSDLMPLYVLPEFCDPAGCCLAPDLDIWCVWLLGCLGYLGFAHPLWSPLPCSPHLLLLCPCSQGWCDWMWGRDLNLPATLLLFFRPSLEPIPPRSLLYTSSPAGPSPSVTCPGSCSIACLIFPSFWNYLEMLQAPIASHRLIPQEMAQVLSPNQR